MEEKVQDNVIYTAQKAIPMSVIVSLLNLCERQVLCLNKVGCCFSGEEEQDK